MRLRTVRPSESGDVIAPARRFRRARRVRRVANVVAGVVVAVAVAAIVLVLAGTMTGAWRIVPVRSGSMAPMAPKGSAVLAQPQSTSRLRVGDVVLFRAPVASHPLVVHRINEIVVHDGERLYRTKGDANPSPDPWLIRMRSTTVWRVHHVIPVLGTAVDEMSKPAPRLAGIVLASLVILGVGLGRIWRRSPAEPAALDAPETAHVAIRAASASKAASVAAAAAASTAAVAQAVDDAIADDTDDALNTA
jgi:signal peptidase I